MFVKEIQQLLKLKKIGYKMKRRKLYQDSLGFCFNEVLSNTI